MSGTLYIVPTPVGNLGDMTPRAVETLNNVDLILAEDTRTSQPLLRHFEITTPLKSHHKFNEHRDCQKIVDALEQGQNIALISDAGTPGISDPGFLIARAAARAGIKVSALPGATAFVPALVSSGLPCDRFFFAGFLPVKKGRKTLIEQISTAPVTTVIYESPLRLTRTLKEFEAVAGAERMGCVAREISKKFGEIITDTLSSLIRHFEQTAPRGEIVFMLSPAPEPPKKEHKNKYAKD